MGCLLSGLAFAIANGKVDVEPIAMKRHKHEFLVSF
jgi:hypothetical protein